ncbi:MAG: hypothetical protein L0Z73_03215 [Gammaproteobacteria bacterium]|nr:hypothetical protein [Gammaproteobacteria bacterium]
MSARSDTDKAIRNIMQYSEREEWLYDQQAVFASHLDPVCQRLGCSQEELFGELAERGYHGMQFAMMFEDFLSRRIPPDNRNIIDDYLKRRGWRETVRGRRYLQLLRDSVLSLYEVVEVSPGSHCDVRDVIRGGAAVRVYEKMGTQNLARWDKLAARVLNMDGKHLFAGGLLLFPAEPAQSLLKVLTESRKQFDKELVRQVGKEAAASITAETDQTTLFLHEAVTAFTSLWLAHVINKLRAPLPEIVNRDGEAVVFTETRFAFLAEHLDTISARMDAAPGWEREQPGEPAWVWFAEQNSGKRKPQHELKFETWQDGQRSISGTLRAQPGVLTLSTNSVERSRRGQAELEKRLHGLIGPALSKLQTPQQLMDERGPSGTRQKREGADDALDPELAAEIFRNFMDQHYRQTLDEPLPMLDNKTPRQCARSKKGRTKVIEWLKYLENSEQHRVGGQQQAAYDFSWMWEELNLTEYRDNPPET